MSPEEASEESFSKEALTRSAGGQRVRLSFNPSSNTTVNLIKEDTAALINLSLCFRSSNVEQTRCAEIAAQKYEEAAMWAVKAATTVTA